MKYWQFFLLSLAIGGALLSPLFAYSHGAEDDLKGFIVTVTPEEIVQGDERPIEIFITDEEENPFTGGEITIKIEQYYEETVALEANEREPGRYVVTHTFPREGTYEIHFSFLDNKGAEKQGTTFVDAITPQKNLTLGTSFIIGIGILLLIAIITGIVKKNIKATVTWIVVIVIAGGLGYSLYVTLKSGAQSSGVVTCIDDGTCYLTAHVHAYVPIEICGEEFRLPIEMGALSAPHTHEEKNVIHWHDRLPYDNKEKRVIDTAPLTLGAFFEEIEIPFNAQTFGEKENGDNCNGISSKLKMFVNGEKSDAFNEYIWNDKDVIFIAFDEREPEEIKQYLQENPIEFPSLGRG